MSHASTLIAFAIGGACGWRWARGAIGRGVAPAGVTERQAQILSLVARGMTTKEIAVHEGITPYSVDTHIRRARGSLGVSSRAAAAALVAGQAVVARPRRSAIRSRAITTSPTISSKGT